MEDKNIKTFGNLSELPKNQREKFFGFDKLNELATSYSELYNSYIKVVLDTGNQNTDLTTYSDLDKEVKKFIDDAKLPINLVLIFANLKFTSNLNYLKKVFKKLPTYDEYYNDFSEIIEDMLKLGKGKLRIYSLADGTFENDRILIGEIHFDISNLEDFGKRLNIINLYGYGDIEILFFVVP